MSHRHDLPKSSLLTTVAAAPTSCWTQRHCPGGILRSMGEAGGSSSRHGSTKMNNNNKDAGKLRARERYWRRWPSSDRREEGDRFRAGTSCWIVPDATSWRMYLPLLNKLVLLRLAQEEAGRNDDGDNNDRRQRHEFVLLESAVELMDERNRNGAEDAASTATGTSSAQGSGTSERNALLRMVQRGQMKAWADLSVREGSTNDNADVDDEWDWLGYEGMTTEERCRHAQVRAGRMLLQWTSSSSSPLSSSAPRVHLVVSDPEFAQYLEHVPMDDGMKVVNVEQLVELLVTDQTSRDQMLNLAVSCREAYHERMERRMRRVQGTVISSNTPLERAVDSYEQHLTPDEIQAGVRAGRLKRGRLEVSRDNSREAFVATKSGTYMVNVRDGNVRAFHHDVVILQELPKALWGRPSKRIVETRDDDAAAPEDDADMADAFVSEPPVPTAIIVAVDKPSRRIFVATQIEVPKDTDSHVLLVPMDLRIPKIRVPAKPYYANQRLKVQIDGWDADSNYPAGRCIQVIGPVGDLETEVTSLLIENQVELELFSTAALACLPATGDSWTVPDDEVARRTDVRTSRLVFSVDPPGCQDIDDSMHAHVLPNGDVEVGVHIADVTHWVSHNSPLDLEAQARGTTFYLVDRRFDMLPSLLSSNLCSLHGNTDRLAVSVIWTYTPDLKRIKSTWFGRTVIHNRAAMTYDQADNILQGKNPDNPKAVPPPPLTAGGPVEHALIEPLRQSLTILTKLARTLRKEREDVGGAVDLSSGDLGNELKFTIVDGIPTKVIPKVEKEIHHTIAELMILANSTVAEKISKRYPESALLRVHRTVDEDRFAELREVLEAYGLSFEGSSNADLAATLKQASKTHPIVDALLKSFATRAMSEAQYVCTGDITSMDDLSHYGLGLKKYTHFTSPIRRYADVVVHKQLLAALDGDQKGSAEKPRTLPAPVSGPTVSLPGSTVISILHGEGLEGGSGDGMDDLLDSLIEGASDLVLQPKIASASVAAESQPLPEVKREDTRKPYAAPEVTQICEGLNLHNRLAKYSSSECQKLFLSLYFRDHFEVTQAVVLKLRSNGFWCYIPKFDLRAPVYVMDKDDRLQVDPALLGLPSDEGLPGSDGFGDFCRILPQGRCELSLHPDEALVISVPDRNARMRVRQLDAVTIQLASGRFDLRARIPSPRAYLVANSTAQAAGTGRVTSSQGRFVVTSNHVQPKDTLATRRIGSSVAAPETSFFQLLSSMTRRSHVADRLTHVELKAVGPAAPAPLCTMTGRIVFGNFVNPNTRAARQAELQKLASADAAQRRAQVQAMTSRRGEYDTTSRIEREATSRQHRLMAEKRNARRSKAR